MYFKVALVIAVLAYTVLADDLEALEENPGRTAHVSRDNYEDVRYFSCTGKPDGNYLHPFDCTRFITCHNGRSADMACGDCDLNNVNGCQGNPYLVYKLEKDWCDWPAITDCHATGTTPSPSDPSECEDRVEGASCDPYDVNCDQCDWCGLEDNKVKSYFFRCVQVNPNNPFVPITGFWKKEVCQDGYLVDRTKKLAGSLVGGQCTHWDELAQSEKDRYLHGEKDCNVDRNICTYGQDTPCSRNYWYKANSQAAPEPKSCEVGHAWNPDKENCGPCASVQGCNNVCS